MNSPTEDLQCQIQRAFLRRIQEVLDSEPAERLEAAFAEANVSWSSFITDAEAFSGVDLFELLHVLNRPANFPGIVLRFSARREILDLGILGYTILSSRDIQQAVQVMQRYHGLTARTYQANFQVLDGRVVHRQWIKPGFRGPRIEIDEEHVTGIWSMLRQLLPEEVDPSGLSLRLGYAAPDYADRYHQYFPGSVEFGHADTELSYPGDWLSLKIHSADDTVERACEAQCNRMLSGLGPGEAVVEDVRRVLLSKPPNLKLGIGYVAARLNLSVRTLERRLQGAGHSFRAIDNEIRMGLAAQYLQLGYLSGTEISYMLGYSQPATFYRAFRNWYGKTPGQLRGRSSSGDGR